MAIHTSSDIIAQRYVVSSSVSHVTMSAASGSMIFGDSPDDKHRFTGSLEFAKKLIDLNAYFSASGIITFKNSLELQKTFKYINTERILIETDSPFLAPIPMRGKKNEPSYIKYTLQKLSEIKSIEFSNLEKITNNNFDRLFF